MTESTTTHKKKEKKPTSRVVHLTAHPRPPAQEAIHSWTGQAPPKSARLDAPPHREHDTASGVTPRRYTRAYHQTAR